MVFLTILALAQILQSFNNSHAQDVEAKIRIESTALAFVRVEGKYLDENPGFERKSFAFLREYARIDNLGDRISEVNLIGKNGQTIAYKKLIAGEFLADGDFQGWNYRINLTIPGKPPDAAHVSWLSAEQGILMLDDLLPQQLTGKAEAVSAKIIFELPQGWRITSTENKIAENVFEAAHVEKAIFFISKHWREREIRANDFKLNFYISGEWQFTDEEAFNMAAEIYGDYRKLFGANPAVRAQICLLKFPQSVQMGTWEAETRGANITILSADMPFKSQSIQRLHEQLRHEIFHLWIPNGVNLSGNYDWFYEGFALYQALKTGVLNNRIRFEDFLDTLSRAYNVDTVQNQRVSLIEASKNRWNGSNTQVYARGMLAAFLCDIALLHESKGKISISEIFRKIFNAHRLPNQRQDGNTAVLSVLAAYAELHLVIEKYIKGVEKIAWQPDLQAAGIEAAEEYSVVKLKVTARPNRRQKELLDKLGYNNWRKLSENSK